MYENGQQVAVAFAASIGYATVGKLDKMERYLLEFKNLISTVGSEKCENNIAVLFCKLP
jgi:hypothetical protein